jgi:hypothetical protein
MTIATQGGSLIVKDGKLAESCGCCGGWWCCPSVATATVSVSLTDYETVVRSAFVFPGGLGYSYARINASQLNNTPQKYELFGQSDCTYFGFNNPSELSLDPNSWMRSLEVNLATPSLSRVLLALPAEFTELSRSFSAFYCPGAGLTRQYEPGYTYGNIGFGSAIFVNPINTNDNNAGRHSPTSTTRQAVNIQATSTGPGSASFTMSFQDTDPDSCINAGQPGNSFIFFTGTKLVGSATIAVTPGCN